MKHPSISIGVWISLFALVSPGITAPAAPVVRDRQNEINISFRVISLGTPKINIPVQSFEEGMLIVRRYLTRNNLKGTYSVRYYVILPNGAQISCRDLTEAKEIAENRMGRIRADIVIIPR
jgi:hypothetical protein